MLRLMRERILKKTPPSRTQLLKIYSTPPQTLSGNVYPAGIDTVRQYDPRMSC